METARKSKAGLWLLAACLILSLQGADAQTNSTVGVPGWGVALLVMMSLILSYLIMCLLCLPMLGRHHGGGHHGGGQSSH